MPLGDEDNQHKSSSQAAQRATDMTDSPAPAPGPSKFELVQKAVMSRLGHKKDSSNIFSELAPVIMTPRMMNNAANAQTRSRSVADTPSISRSGPKMNFATLGRAPLRLGLGSRRVTSRDLAIVEATDELLLSDLPEPTGESSNVSFLRGFNATIPSAESGKTRRRQMRSVETPRLGLKKLGMSARGLLTAEDDDHEGQSEDDMVVVGRQDPGQRKGKRKGRESLAATKILGREELSRQRKEIMKDKENIHVRRSLIKSEIDEIAQKITALDEIRTKLEKDLLKLQEDELELDDELEGVKERAKFEQSSNSQSKPESSMHLPQTTRRRRGPSFLPSEHDELPPGIAFMTLASHATPITSLDFSEPYGTLVTSSQEDTQPRVWDLLSGAELGRLRGHTEPVKVLQVEGNVCLSGSDDGTVRLWDLRRVDAEQEVHSDEGEMVSLSDVAEDDESENSSHHANGKIRSSDEKSPADACDRVLEGHTRSVTALYFENDCLVTGASDKTLRQWDLTTGQCVMTMDILWAISHPQPSYGGGPSNGLFSGAAAAVGSFAVPTPPAADGSWEMYQDFVGGVQFWGYGLVSGSGDSAVRMWDMRTGQAHRTLHGHTGPVTCVQFDELHVMSGSLDKTVKIWDLRTGGVFETLKYDHAVTALQFDTRKVVAATGENGVKIYNRTSMQHSSLMTNGHTSPVERLRYMDRYLVSGGRDATVKVWSL